MTKTGSDEIVIRKSTVKAFMITLFSFTMGGFSVFMLLDGRINAGPSEAELLELIAEGRIVYDTNCSRCHGISGQGGMGPPHNDEGHTWEHPDDELVQTVLNGRSMMPSFRGTLDEAEVEAALTYIKTMWTKEQRDFQQDATP